ncbi:PD-(D/E)XK motif protein [Kocuria coralli]|uniref:PD-(D/E)XK motif protein n=1 Tax=Kocuria coralli TaxID=1461025 RepID=A0A5J5KVQ1_9MICC|nr:PD-(D/E)XK motif protein [Kocuria coralli]KAA9393011.1 PD-(D/E)XK motif protein [Kocuria coralli]
MSDEREREFTVETLDRYMRAEVETRHVLSEMPRCEMIIDPRASRLVLRTPDAGSYPETGAYRRLAFEVVEEPGESGVWAELTVDASGMAYEAYSLVMSVVDQLEAGRPLKHALDESLATFKELLTKRWKLSEDQEIGLFGELGLFAHLVAELGEEAATSSWLGPENEEHDFVLPDFDAEVKTTRNETRAHVIGGLGQLAPSPARPLYLVSVQVTAAGAASEGQTLPERVNKVRAMLDSSARVFDEHLASLGWDPRTAADLYTQGYFARSEPRVYLVDIDFPAITHEGIASIVQRPELVVGAVYRIDVTAIEASTPPSQLSGYCERSSSDS